MLARCRRCSSWPTAPQAPIHTHQPAAGVGATLHLLARRRRRSPRVSARRSTISTAPRAPHDAPTAPQARRSARSSPSQAPLHPSQPTAAGATPSAPARRRRHSSCPSPPQAPLLVPQPAAQAALRKCWPAAGVDHRATAPQAPTHTHWPAAGATPRPPRRARWATARRRRHFSWPTARTLVLARRGCRSALAARRPRDTSRGEVLLQACDGSMRLVSFAGGGDLLRGGGCAWQRRWQMQVTAMTGSERTAMHAT